MFAFLTAPSELVQNPAKMDELAADRLEALAQADMEADAAAVAAVTVAGKTMREEADRLLAEHRDRTGELRKAMKVRRKYIAWPKLLSVGISYGTLRVAISSACLCCSCQHSQPPNSL